MTQQLPDDFADRHSPAPVRARHTAFKGYVWDVVTDEVDLGAGGVVSRDYVQHTGAVAVVALRGEPGAEEVVLIQQYRHPVGTYDWEIPAGLLDVPGEDPHAAAARELAEEAQLGAREWAVLVDLFTSPGGISENLRVFLARDVFPFTAEGFVAAGEEHEMPVGWISLDTAATAALEGRMHNAVAIAAILAALRARDNGFAGLRPADAPWPEHPAYR
ncbi:NUDIX domain-containing protein [Yimella sp. cx-51]|uniref:NUDIX domain-containing protein n=1 Tax=Yimella sp. cx-51 TaxID=2770551 RepID=UPI00165D8A7E|nr:NUDIX hydrolase [Yimella sp. cx-51]MBC9957544.1 NUDIX hydrolase [Yimella sp. cx-51]MBD2760786.1 NUDIX hydrolase [Yimella sp. cx-573]QTH39232.1 NUDIX hydrolase [Yimella sp. cx-51]